MTGRTISFRKAVESDLELVHKWMQEPHVHPFWQLNLPLEAFGVHFRKALNDSHQTVYIGLMDNEPMSYWESYWVEGDVLEESYETRPYDQGVHLLIGEKGYLGKGYALPLLRAMVSFQFEHEKTEKVVAEPDRRNEKMIHVFEKCGFRKVAPITLPDKQAMLLFCDRKEFEKRWKHD
ncbi:GNAT family N-acetyltransferase [Salimicrobium sp. PL1-032A]|uniref:GNAT family N-acetyltransferase n=1 Tax=Salimicrobium sp. PL1-032A TaxID=3095364 RepID=UPI0032611868